MTPKDRKSALAEHLKSAILTLELPPGSDLDEVALGHAFGLSRTPVREVFRDLDGLGYVELRENRGARASSLAHTEIRDFFLSAPMVYGAVLRLASRNKTPCLLAELKEAQGAFRAALRSGGPTARTLANNRFHAVTGAMAGNVYIAPSFQRLLIDHARIGMTFYDPLSDRDAQDLKTASEQHDAMIAAIETGNEAAAAALSDEHWALSRCQIERYVMPEPLDAPLGDPEVLSAGGIT
ncbi:MAG: GntR family transcriptional regulator [Pseudomonadota bacterium]